MKLTRLLLTLEGERAAFEAYVSRQRMLNGCHLPFMTRQVVNELKKRFNRYRTMFSWHGDILIWLDPEDMNNEVVVMRPVLIVYEAKDLQVYDLADIGLMWEIATGKEKKIYRAS